MLELQILPENYPMQVFGYPTTYEASQAGPVTLTITEATHETEIRNFTMSATSITQKGSVTFKGVVWDKDANKAVIGGAKVEIHAQGPSFPSRTPVATGSTLADGSFSIDWTPGVGVAPGSYTIWAFFPLQTV
jgi:hypothetical protein